MNEHTTKSSSHFSPGDGWVDAYLDGELKNGSKKRVEEHLAQCTTCRAQLAQRRALSSLLQEAPPASELKPLEQFVAEVGLQLPRQAAPAPRYWSGSAGWYLVPILLLLGGVFLLTTILLGGLAAWFPGIQNLPGAVPLPVLYDFSGSQWIKDLLEWLTPFGWLNLNWLSGLIGLALVALLYVCWLAAWWVHSRNDLYH